jgi:hypothetical protein
MRISRTLVIGLTALAVAACVSSHIMIGQARPPISPDDVKIYFHPPETKYEEIALIDTSSKGGFGMTAQGKTDVVIKRLKKEAAELGANGVLLAGVGDQSGGSVSSGFGQATVSGNHAYGSGVGISTNINHKQGNGVAIYVPPN